MPAHDLTVHPPAWATMLASGLRRNLNRYKTIWKQHPVPTIAKTTRQKIDSVQNEINGKVGKRELHCSKEGEKSLEPFHLHLFIPSSRSEVSGKKVRCETSSSERKKWTCGTSFFPGLLRLIYLCVQFKFLISVLSWNINWLGLVGGEMRKRSKKSFDPVLT